MSVEVYVHKRKKTLIEEIATESMTVEKLHGKVCTEEKLKKTDFYFVDAVTRCHLPHNVTMTALNVSHIEVVHRQEIVKVSMQAVCYRQSGPASVAKSEYPHDVTFLIQKTSSERKRVFWELLAAFLGSTTSFTGPGPFNSAIRPFLVLTRTDSEDSVIMLNPNLDIGKFLNAVERRQYMFSVGYWKSYQEGPLINITVQRYNPRISMEFQAEHQTNITIRDVAEAVSLQVTESQSRCILLHQGNECTTDTRLSDLAQCTRDASNVYLMLDILDELTVDVHFEPEGWDAQVTVKISDGSEQLIRQFLAEFHPNAKPQLFQLFYRNEEMSVGTTLEDLLEPSGKDPQSRMHFVLSLAWETFDITVANNDQTHEISVRFPPFDTLEKFVDSITMKISEELERDVGAHEIDLYAVLGKDDEEKIQLQIDDQRLDELIEEMNGERMDGNRAIVTFIVELPNG
jgi:hypothetical protein